MERFDKRPALTGRMQGAYAFAMLAAFSVIAVLIVVTGARVYRSIERSAAENSAARTSVAYLVNKLRAHDAAGAVTVLDADGLSVLALSDTADGGSRYTTYIYCDGASLLEYYAPAERGFDRALGEPVTDAQAFSASVEGSLAAFTVTGPDGIARSAHVYLASGEGA